MRQLTCNHLRLNIRLENQNSVTLHDLLFEFHRKVLSFCVCGSISLWECLQEIDYTLMKRSHNKWKEITLGVKSLNYITYVNTPFLEVGNNSSIYWMLPMWQAVCLIHPRHYFYLIFLKILQGGWLLSCFHMRKTAYFAIVYWATITADPVLGL